MTEYLILDIIIEFNDFKQSILQHAHSNYLVKVKASCKALHLRSFQLYLIQGFKLNFKKFHVKENIYYYKSHDQ